MPDLRKQRIRPLLPPKDKLSELDWSLEKGASCLLWLLLLLCPFWLCIDRREPDNPSSEEKKRWDEFRAYWVLGWLVLLFVIWVINPVPLGLRIFFAILALVRLLEVFTTGLGTTLAQAQQVRARSVVTIAIYAVQVVLIFATLDHSFATTDFVTGPRTNQVPATRAVDYLYISWSDMTTLGNSIYVPRGDAARFLQVSTTTSGLLLLGVLLAFGIDAVKDGETARRNLAPPQRPLAPHGTNPREADF